MRAGTYNKVTRVAPLGDPGRRPGATVAILSCGHARTCVRARKGQRMWCRICTIADANKAQHAPITTTRAKMDAAIARTVARILKQHGVKLPAEATH